MNRSWFALVLALFVRSSCEAIPFTDGLGAVSDFLAVGGALVGKTAVTPAFSVHTWRNDDYGYYRNSQFGSHRKVNRDPITGLYYFYTRTLQSDGSIQESAAPFIVGALLRENYSCNISHTGPDGVYYRTVYNRLEDFEIVVWHASTPVKSGVFPPGSPYRIVLETSGARVAKDCNPVSPFTAIFNTQVSLGESGHAICKFGWVDYDYAWPVACWGEEK